MRILILSQFFDPEPASIPGMPLASWLTARGHEVEVLTGFPNYPGGHFYPGQPVRLWRREQMDDVKVNRVLLYPSHDRSPLRRVANYTSFSLSASTLGTLLVRKPDVVYVYHPPATVGLPALLWKALGGVPFLFHVQDLWPESVVDSGMVADGSARRVVARGIEWWSRRIYAQAGAIVTISEGMKDHLKQRGVPAEKLSVIPNWAEEDTFFPMARDAGLGQRLGTAGRFNLMFSGNLGLYQNLDVLMHAAHLLRDTPQVQVVVVGTGQLETELRQLNEQLQLDNVRFIGRLPYQEMGPVTALADALLVSLQDRPFLSVTIPGKTQVAMACARPIVMAVRGDAARLVESAHCGVVCPPGDAPTLAAAVRQLASLPDEERLAMGERGRRYYELNMSLDRGARKLETLLLDLGGRNTRS
jgi:glycosyltransferase involved in cell wall biosynthesis